MSRARRTNLKFWIWTSVTVSLAAGLLASTWPVVHHYLTDQAAGLVQAGKSAQGSEATLDFRLANLLDPGREDAAWRYAAVEFSNGDPQAALNTLERAVTVGEGSDALVVRVKALLETGQTTQAAAAAETLARTGTTDQQLVTAAYAFGADGQGSKAAALEPRLSSPEALRSAARAATADVPLADELATSGLVRSASTLLEHLPASPARNLRLATLKAASPTKANRQTAADLYHSYLTAMPADATTRLRYAAVLDELKQPGAAHTQRQLAADITAGHP